MAGITRYNKDTAFGLKGGNAHAVGDIVGCDSNGVAVKADADAPIRAIGVIIVDADAKDKRNSVSDDCEVEYPGSNFTPGGQIYLSATPGGITQTAPATNGHLRQALGIAISATCVRFKISPIALQFQTSGNSTVAFAA